jgi:hypothetical protein
MDKDTYDHDECSYLNKAKGRVMSDCKHAIVTNQKSALPFGSMVPAEDMQICCICGQLRSQQWGPWHEPINVKERTMAEDGKTEKQKEGA